MNPSKKDFWFLPLGGSGEIGMNLNLYGYDDSWLMVDLGVTFNNDLGVDIITPDPEFIVKRKDKLKGIVLTHAHEDHIGAIPYLWNLLQCPLYATPFTASVIRSKIKECSWHKQVDLREIPLSASFNVGPFELEYVTLTHSIPEPNAVFIKTPLGNILHTGDWKIDPEPLVGGVTNINRLEEIGKEGVQAIVCDSTNVFCPNVSGSESKVRLKLNDVIQGYSDKRIIVACFASNIARVESILNAAKNAGRKVALLGRSLSSMVQNALKCGYLQKFEDIILDDIPSNYPDNKLLVVATGSQGESKAALSRIAWQKHPDLKIQNGDVVIFSSRVIPGNEKAIHALQNMLCECGATIITSDDEDIHVSGHPGQEELKMMYSWLQPNWVIPVHGEFRHMKAQFELAQSLQIKSLVPKNGTLIDLLEPKIIDVVENGRLYLDGKKMVPSNSRSIMDRKYLSVQGILFVSMVLNSKGHLARPIQITMKGIPLEDKDLISALDKEIRRLAKSNLNGREDEIRKVFRSIIVQMCAKRPLIELHVFKDY